MNLKKETAIAGGLVSGVTFAVGILIHKHYAADETDIVWYLLMMLAAAVSWVGYFAANASDEKAMRNVLNATTIGSLGVLVVLFVKLIPCFCDDPTPPTRRVPVQGRGGESPKQEVDRTPQFTSATFGGPYPCQEVRKKLTNFSIYRRMLLDYVDVRPLTRELLVRSVIANSETFGVTRDDAHEHGHRFQRYNYAITEAGEIRVAVWTIDTVKRDEFKQRFQFELPAGDGVMIDFGAEDPFETDAKNGSSPHWIYTPDGSGAKRVGILDALSKHFRIAQGNVGISDFTAEKWMATTVAYAGEIVVDTRPETGEEDRHYYLNNGSGTYRPDAHFLPGVAALFQTNVRIAPRYLQSAGQSAWQSTIQGSVIAEEPPAE